MSALNPAAPRRHVLARRIACDGFQRDDGLWNLEASIVDTRPFSYVEVDRGTRDASSEVHNMSVRLTFDDGLVVRAIEVSMNEVPHPECVTNMANYQRLVGAKIGVGWRQAVKAALGDVKGCTHVRELLVTMATPAFQTVGSRGLQEGVESWDVKTIVGGCIAWAPDSELLVRMRLDPKAD